MQNNRTLVIGDIHGGFRGLLQLIERVKITPEDLLIFLGDFADGWSQTPEVISYLISLNNTHKCIFLRGNHDTLLLEYLKTNSDNELWKRHGGASTIIAYTNIDSFVRNEHIQFLEDLEDYYIDQESRLFIHAVFTNLKGVQHEYFNKTFYWDRTLWETALALDKNIQINALEYPNRFKCYSEIYIGHTPTTRLKLTTPQNRANIWNIDTGAAYTGKITALDINSKEYWQSDLLMELYPEEKGRN